MILRYFLLPHRISHSYNYIQQQRTTMQFSTSLMIAIAALVSDTTANKTPAKALTIDSCEKSHMDFQFSSCKNYIFKESAPTCPSGTKAVCRFAPISHYAKTGVSVSHKCKTFIETRGDSYYYFCQQKKKPVNLDPCPESPYTPSLKTCQEYLPSESAPACPSGTTVTCRFAPIGVMNSVSDTCKSVIKSRGGVAYYYTCK